SHPFVVLGSRKSEGDVDPLERRIRDADLLAQLGERPVGPWRTTPAGLDISEREIARLHGGRHGVLVDAPPIEVDHDTRPQHRRPWVRRVLLGLHDPELGESTDVLGCRAGPLRDLSLGEAFRYQDTYSLGFATNASWHAREQK